MEFISTIWHWIKVMKAAATFCYCICPTRGHLSSLYANRAAFDAVAHYCGAHRAGRRVHQAFIKKTARVAVKGQQLPLIPN